MTDLDDKVRELAANKYGGDPSDYNRDEYDATSARFAAIELDLDGPPAAEPVDIPAAGEPPERTIERLKHQLELAHERIDNLAVSATANAPLLPAHDTHGLACGMHPNIAVSMSTDSVKCRICGADLAPIDVLRQYAKGERRFVQTIDALRDERARLQKEIAELTRIRNNLNAQVRRRKAPR